ncbi:MAG: metallophosphoesterase [Actinobacteria bacterium]|nr:metallophosphoesterase [Actinomycetota bacterium]
MLLVVVGAVVVLGGAAVLARQRLVVATTEPGPGRDRASRAFLVAGLVVLGALAVSVGGHSSDLAARVRPISVVLAVALYLVLALAVLEVGRLALGLTGRWRSARRPGGDGVGPDESVDPARRLALARLAAGGAGAAAIGATAFGYRQANRPIPPKHVTVDLARLPTGFDGVRVALLADVHLTRGLRERGFMAEVVDTVNAEGVDLAVLVGDLVDGSVADLGAAAAPLADLEAPLGRFFATGNHEYYSGAEEWVAHLPTLGWTVLRNERVELRRAGHVVDVVGLDDVEGERHGVGPDLDAGFGGRDLDRFALVLAHQPVLAADVAARGADLVLSGHTHGGQLWPLGSLVRAQQGHLAGLGREGDAVVYVTRGVGTWGPPVRVAAPPEVTILTLRRA